MDKQLDKTHLSIIIDNLMYKDQETIKSYIKSTSEAIINNDLEHMNCDIIAEDLHEISILLYDFNRLKNKKSMLKYIK